MSEAWAMRHLSDMALSKLGVPQGSKLAILLAEDIAYQIQVGGVEHAVKFFAESPFVQRKLADPKWRATL